MSDKVSGVAGTIMMLLACQWRFLVIGERNFVSPLCLLLYACFLKSTLMRAQ